MTNRSNLISIDVNEVIIEKEMLGDIFTIKMAVIYASNKLIGEFQSLYIYDMLKDVQGKSTGLNTAKQNKMKGSTSQLTNHV